MRQVNARAALVAALVAASPAPSNAQAAPVPDLSGNWGRNFLFFEPPASGPIPVVGRIMRADGTIAPRGGGRRSSAPTPDPDWRRRGCSGSGTRTRNDPRAAFHCT
jgi:hypothetical protein